MAETRSLIISFVFVCVLFASSTLMCTAEGEVCEVVILDALIAGSVGKINTGTLVKTQQVCSATEVICNEYCAKQYALIGKLVKGGEVGKCIYPNGEVIDTGYCACCQLK
ncbi:hypothetical protein MKX03_030734 [Papaver bracteatum]|nr:hypothetical protein MKX03_030734 [Papaver bracteatum]